MNSEITDLQLGQIKVHGILMSVVFGLLLPLTAIVARYYKVLTISLTLSQSQVKGMWKVLHASIVAVAMVLITIALVSAFTAFGTNGLHSMHAQIVIITFLTFQGIVICCVIVVQAILGITSSQCYNADAKSESAIDEWHGFFGCLIVFLGYVNVLLGIQQIHDILNDDSATPFLFGFFVIILLFGVAPLVLEIRIGR